jgi:hypothetical protein
MPPGAKLSVRRRLKDQDGTSGASLLMTDTKVSATPLVATPSNAAAAV